MDGGDWWATVHGVPKSWTQLSNFTFTQKGKKKGKTTHIQNYLNEQQINYTCQKNACYLILFIK